MRIADKCADCLYRKQLAKTDNKEYHAKVKKLLDERTDEDCSPYMVYLFNQIYEEIFGAPESYKEIKKQYNDLVLSMEDSLREKIEASENPIAAAFLYARIGNYIDFGAMNQVDPDQFLALFDDAKLSEMDMRTMESFCRQCETAKEFLLLTDNCGEVVIDKLLLEQMHKAYPQMRIRAMVRGGEILNDATMEDAEYVGLTQVAEVISNGLATAGTVYNKLTLEAKSAVDTADVILAKGQGNYESFSGQGRHAFFAFLCKCDLFTERFQVPRLTGMFVEEV